MNTPASTPPGPPAATPGTAAVPPCGQNRRLVDFGLRTAATAGLVSMYYAVRGPLTAQPMQEKLSQLISVPVDSITLRVMCVTLLLALLVLVWKKYVLGDPRFHAPLLVTTILAVGDAAFNILENHPAPPWLVSLTGGVVMEYSPTFVAIVVTIVAEIILGRFFWGKWPHLASAYISGISVGILIKSSSLWPFVLCGLISITSKYVLRVGNRHLWNPTNFGVTMMLFLAPTHVASLSVQAGNNGLAVVVIWLLGGMIMYRIGRFHVPVAFVATFIPLAFLRSFVTGHAWQTELAPLFSPMFQLYIFFMITDPKTTTRTRPRRIVVAMLVAVMETVCRLVFKDIHSLYHALFTVGPVANLIEIYYDGRQARIKQAASTAAASPPANLESAETPTPTTVAAAVSTSAPAPAAVEPQPARG